MESRFCRFCGYQMPDPFFQPADPMAQRRPYSWQTDEFQTRSSKRQSVRATVENFPTPRYPQMQGSQAMVASAHAPLAGNYRCPHCGTHYLPVIERRISTAGWITFALLLVFTFIFFWIGLLLKEDVSVCPVCKFRLN
ncbi:MAG: LITAF-like zinc ribbon domain-containing protein [Pyrinomonadaceae bacterium]